MFELKAPVTAKRLKDYPLNNWQQAADNCEICGHHYLVKVTFVDKTGNYGDVEFWAAHKTDCQRCLGEESEQDVAGWEFADKSVHMFGQEFLPIKARTNVGPCLNCWRLIVGTPIILFLQEGRGGELDFCLKCAGDLGIVSALTRAVPPK